MMIVVFVRQRRRETQKKVSMAHKKTGERV